MFENFEDLIESLTIFQAGKVVATPDEVGAIVDHLIRCRSELSRLKDCTSEQDNEIIDRVLKGE